MPANIPNTTLVTLGRILPSTEVNSQAAMERASVLDRYFDDISVEPVDSDEQGWNKIKDKPALWH